MSALQPFFFEGREVRVVCDEQGDPWFVVKDVCAVLGLTNVTEATRSLDGDELSSEILNSGGQRREMSTVSESGLYALIFTSRKPEAKAFRKWVTGTVLPAIRKTGRFEASGLTGCKQALSSTDLPVAARRLKPSVRAVALNCSLQVAKMEGGSLPDIRNYFLEFCEMVGAGEVAVQAGDVEEGDDDRREAFYEWMRACLVPQSGKIVKFAVCYESFRKYCEEKGVIFTWSWKRFSKALEHYFPKRKSNGVMVLVGVRLKTTAEAA